ncbi:MAG: TonB family protein [Pseudoxanthomonas suwonensis]|nr:TonB family protein [Pseudoxanthomonas suwonensis]
MSQPQPEPDRRSRWNPGGKALWWVLAAFAVGLLLFLLLWMRQGRDDGFYRGAADPAAEPGQVFQPLPAPLPAGEPGERTAPGGDPFSEQILEPLPEPPPQVAEPARPAPPSAPPPAERPPAQPPRMAVGDAPPRPVTSPAPSYPREALRNRESGTVLLRVDVGTDGRPANVSVTRGSGSRDLDRAAVRAVQRWRFEPARRGGQVVMGTLDIPIDFTLE